MKKIVNLLITLLIVMSMLFTVSVNVFAEENNYNEVSDIETLIEEAESIAEREDVKLQENDAYIKESFDLEEGGTLTIEMYDLEEGETINDIIAATPLPTAVSDGDYISVPSGSMQTVDHIIYRTKYKDYGNRYFTAKYTFGYPTGSVTILTENHYSIDDYGLKTRYGVTVPSHEGTFSGFKSRWDITDNSASMPGHDINIVGLIEYQIGSGIGLSKGPRHMKLDTRVKLERLETKARRAEITEHAYFSRTKTAI